MSELVKMSLVFGFLIAFVVLVVVLARTGNKPVAASDDGKQPDSDAGRTPARKG